MNAPKNRGEFLRRLGVRTMDSGDGVQAPVLSEGGYTLKEPCETCGATRITVEWDDKIKGFEGTVRHAGDQGCVDSVATLLAEMTPAPEPKLGPRGEVIEPKETTKVGSSTPGITYVQFVKPVSCPATIEGGTLSAWRRDKHSNAIALSINGSGCVLTWPGMRTTVMPSNIAYIAERVE